MAKGKTYAKANNNLADFKQQVKSGTIKNLYVFYGDEDYLKLRYIEQLKKKYIPDENEEFNYIFLDGKNIDLSDIVQAVEGYPVSADKKMVVVQDFDLTSVKEKEMSKINELLDLLDDTVILIFTFLTIKIEKPEEIAKKLSGKSFDVDFQYQNTSELAKWVNKHTETVGKTLTTDALNYFIEKCGPSMHNLISEIQKIINVTKNKTITLTEVKSIVTPTLEATAFEFADAIADRRFDESYNLLNVLFALKEEPVVILSAISWNISTLYKVKLAYMNGVSNDKVAADFKINPYVARKMMSQCQGSSIELKTLRKWLLALNTADIRLKSSPLDNRLILETMIGDMILADMKR